MPMAFANVFQESLEFENWDVCLLEKKKKQEQGGYLLLYFYFLNDWVVEFFCYTANFHRNSSL